MRIGTYNVHGLSGWPVDAAETAIGAAGGPRARAHFARVFAELDCDVLAIQEGIADEAMREIADALGAHLTTFPSPERWPGHLLSRRPLRDACVLDGQRAAHGIAAFSRSGGSVLVEMQRGDALGIVAVHLHPHDAGVREREAELVVARTRALLERTPQVAVLGDLNCSPDEAPHARLAELGLIHAPRVVLGHVPATRPAVGEPDRAHDHVYLSPALAARLVDARVVNASGFHHGAPLEPGAWVHSDHLPLVVDLA